MSNETRQRMIERTALLLAQKGLQGTSFSEVLEASGAPRGSLYHHFPGGKDELVLAAIAHAGERALKVMDGAAGLPADEVARRFFALWRTVLERSQFSAGCAAAAVTVASISPDLLDGTAKVFRSWRSRLAELFAAGSVPAELAPALAMAVIAICEGAVILCRAEKSFEPFDSVVEGEVGRVRAAMRI